MRVTSLDLELNQPSQKIIQIGACVGDLKTGEIFEELRLYVKIDEPLNPYIIQLTGVTEEHLATEGLELKTAYAAMADMHLRHDCLINPLTWGGGDSLELRQQLGEVEKFCFGRRWLDIKTVFQFHQMAKDQKIQAGLAKALTRVGMAFKGRKHDALDDAINTFKLAAKLLTS